MLDREIIFIKILFDCFQESIRNSRNHYFEFPDTADFLVFCNFFLFEVLHIVMPVLLIDIAQNSED